MTLRTQTNAPSSLPVVTYAEVRDHIRTGDLLLCAGTSVMSRLIQRATESPWSHVALIVRVREIDRVLVLESVESIGVRAVPLSHYLHDYNGTKHGYDGGLVIARHSAFEALADEAVLEMLGFAVDALGRRYDTGEILRIAARIAASRFPPQMHNTRDSDLERRDDTYICSEYVWECLHAAGIDVACDTRGFIAPADFAMDHAIRQCWTLRRA